MSRYFDSSRFTFDELKNALASIDVHTISADYGEMGEDFGKFFRRQLFERIGLAAAAKDSQYAYFHASEAMENLSAYTILRLLALNPSIANVPVTWQFADLEDAAWASRQTFIRPLDPPSQFLIVTEGSSDAKIIKHAFKLLRPHIADFFHFVDMEEGYPFSGTGNLFKFIQGLISISVLNNIVVIYDNDAEGTFSAQRSRELNLPPNIVILKLPDSVHFSEFETIGPQGRQKADINGRAAAIKCYLDLGQDPAVRWTTFNNKTGTYQGELTNKTDYMREFLNQRGRIEGYNYSRIETVLDMIVTNCAQMREASLASSNEKDSGGDHDDAARDERGGTSGGIIGTQSAPTPLTDRPSVWRRGSSRQRPRTCRANPG